VPLASPDERFGSKSIRVPLGSTSGRADVVRRSWSWPTELLSGHFDPASSLGEVAYEVGPVGTEAIATTAVIRSPGGRLDGSWE